MITQAICDKCGYVGTPDGVDTCPDCGQRGMTAIDDLGGEDHFDFDDDADGKPAAGNPDSLEDLAEDELDKDFDESDDL